MAQLRPRVIGSISAQLESGVILLFVTRIAQVAATPATGADLPADTPASVEIVLKEILIVLLDVRVDAPALAVDDDLDEVALEGRDLVPGYVRVDDFAHERRVGVAVQQVQRLVAEQFLAVILVIDVQVDGTFQIRRHGKVG